MKKNFKFSLFLVALMIIASAFTASALKSSKNEALFSVGKINELYWYAADNTTYTGRFKNLADEMSFLAANQQSYNFYSSPVSGSVAYEYGYTVQNPSGSPAQTIYRKAK